MARRVVKEVHHTSGGGGFGVLGVIIGALLVVGAVFFFAGGTDMFANRGGSSGPSVTVNTTPSGGANSVTRPITPSAPATTGSGQAR